MIALTDPANPAHSTHTISTNGRTAQRIWAPRCFPLSKNVVGILTGIALKSNREHCGFLTRRLEIFPVKNVHEHPHHNFYMDLEDSSQTIEKIYGEYNSEILGIWHTHPNNVPWPSPRDLVGWPNPDLQWRYWVVTCNEVIEWSLVCD